METVVIIGVHGSGKTTTATLLADELGYRYVEVEEIYDTLELGVSDQLHRQIIFLAGYTRTFLAEYYRSARTGARGVVFDSHPILNVPYILWWVGGWTGHRLAGIQLALASMLPPVDLAVLLDADDVDVVIGRILRRARRGAVDVEADKRYIEYVARGLRAVFGHLPARRRLVVPASLEVEERVRMILSGLRR